VNSVQVLVTAVSTIPVPPEMAALQVRYKSDGWPDMRTRAGKRWAEMFRAIEDEQIERYYSKAETA
jgi:hypothetical protein